MYKHIDPSTHNLLAEKIKFNKKISLEEFVHLRDGPLNDSAMKKLLDYYAVEDNFALGDALIFDKNVIHTSVMLGDGPVEKRAAFVMRFFEENSRYDKKRAQDLEIPRNHFNYSGPTRFHLEVASSDGDLLVISKLFSNQEYRSLKSLETVSH